MNHTSSEVRDCGCHHDGLAGLHDCGPLRTGVVPKLQSLTKLMHGQQRTASHGLWSMLPRFAAAVPGIPLALFVDLRNENLGLWYLSGKS